MFRFAPSFNGDISQWDVGDVQNMYAMFYGASLFNSDISEWGVFSVTNMHLMFSMATSFDGDISRWDVSGVTNMQCMFMNAPAFNVDISKWDVSSVTNMDSMFWEAISFKQKLCGAAWVRSTASKKAMFTASRGSISRKVCTSTERELKLVRTPITTPVSTSALAVAVTNQMT